MPSVPLVPHQPNGVADPFIKLSPIVSRDQTCRRPQHVPRTLEFIAAEHGKALFGSLTTFRIWALLLCGCSAINLAGSALTRTPCRYGSLLSPRMCHRIQLTARRIMAVSGRNSHLFQYGLTHIDWQQNINALNSNFGTASDLKALVSAVHARGMVS